MFSVEKGGNFYFYDELLVKYNRKREYVVSVVLINITLLGRDY